jgi:hypothetical protein
LIPSAIHVLSVKYTCLLFEMSIKFSVPAPQSLAIADGGTYIRTPVAEEEARVRSPWAGRNEEGLKAEAEAAIAATRATRSMVKRPIVTSKMRSLADKRCPGKGVISRPYTSVLARVNPRGP